LPARGAASDAGSVALGDLDEAASMLKDQDISATASKIRGLTRKAFRRLAKALAVVAARREGGPARGLPFFDIREGDSKAAAKRLEAYAEDAENNGFKDWALFTLGKLGPAGREAVARSSPRIKAAGSMQIAGLMHEYGLAVKTLPAFEFKRVDRGFFASLPRGKDGAGKGAPAPPRGKPEAAASAAPEDGPKPAPGAPDGGPRCGPRPDALNPDGTAPDGTPAGGPSEGRGRAYAPDTGDA
jgi:hypothetical protein